MHGLMIDRKPQVWKIFPLKLVCNAVALPPDHPLMPVLWFPEEDSAEEEAEEWEDAAGGNEVEVEVDAEGLASLKELGAAGAEAALEDIPLGKRKRGRKPGRGTYKSCCITNHVQCFPNRRPGISVCQTTQLSTRLV